MKTSSNITDYILVKADTNSDWDNCCFALIHCTAQWRELATQWLNTTQAIENEMCFASLKFYDTSVDFYRTDEMGQAEIDRILGERNWAFVEMDENEPETFSAPENRLDSYRLTFYRCGTAMYTAHGKYSGDEFFTTEFSISDILNYHQESIKIIQLY